MPFFFTQLGLKTVESSLIYGKVCHMEFANDSVCSASVRGWFPRPHSKLDVSNSPDDK